MCVVKQRQNAINGPLRVHIPMHLVQSNHQLMLQPAKCVLYQHMQVWAVRRQLNVLGSVQPQLLQTVLELVDGGIVP